MRTYTGLTGDGTLMTISCPVWCTADHGSPLGREAYPDNVDDTFHTSDEIAIVPPPDPYTAEPYNVVPQLRATLMLHSADKGPDALCIHLSLEEAGHRAAEMDVAQTDWMIAQLQGYTEQLQVLRGHLAEQTRHRSVGQVPVTGC